MTLPWRLSRTASAATSSRSVTTVISAAPGILTSQMPVAHWHEQIGGPTLADSILDRLLHNAYRLELKGESMRKKLGGKPEPEDGQ